MNGATKWIAILLSAAIVLVSVVLYVADTRAIANANEERIQQVEVTLKEDIGEIKAQLGEIIDHLRPYREYDR